MRLILLGPPGCGKGTQADLLSRRHSLEHIGTGDLLRESIRLKTPAGQRAQPYVASGQLVPDDLVNDIITERFQRPDRPERFVLDGYPRTLAQAQSLDDLLQRENLRLTMVLRLLVPDAEIVHRVGGRWSCPKPGCKATYHTENNPPRVAEICDRCGTKLVQRVDDKVETVRARLTVYHQNTEKLIPHYAKQGLLHEVSGEGEIEEVYAAIMKVLAP